MREKTRLSRTWSTVSSVSIPVFGTIFRGCRERRESEAACMALHQIAGSIRHNPSRVNELFTKLGILQQRVAPGRPLGIACET
jgi:hypothetical protein